MCTHEVFGDWHRPCGHFIKRYYSGEKNDCGQGDCFYSEQHAHRAPNCPCSRTKYDERRIVNMFHQPCDACRNAAFDRLARRD